MCVYTMPTYTPIKTPAIPDLNNSAKQKQRSQADKLQQQTSTTNNAKGSAK